MTPSVSERAVIFLVGMVQFVNILDFMVVMPLGPDFALALDIPISNLGYIGGSYTAAAAVSGLLGAFVLDRFDRRPALALSLLGLTLGTAAGALAQGLGTLIAARLLAGFFGGPATSIAYSIVADVVPLERRGKAMGAVMGAFSVASVVGVPLSLEIAMRAGWRAPFLAIAALGVLGAAAALLVLPPLRGHIAAEKTAPQVGLAELFGRRLVLLSYAMTAVIMVGTFALVPNIAGYLLQNVGYPREHLGRLYLAGGIVSFATLRLCGRLVDRYGSFRIGTIGCAMFVVIVALSFVRFPPALPVMGIFIGFMFANSFRNVAYNTLTTKVPRPAERARFMSIQSAVQHLASASGAFLSAHLLTELPDHRLEGMPRVGLFTITLTLFIPLLLRIVEQRVDRSAMRPS